MVPAAAVLLGLEAVDFAAALRGDGAFGEAVDAVVEVGVFLVEAVPVDGGAVMRISNGSRTLGSRAEPPVGFEVIDDGDLDGITPVGKYGRAFGKVNNRCQMYRIQVLTNQLSCLNPVLVEAWPHEPENTLLTVDQHNLLFNNAIRTSPVVDFR